MNTTKNLHDVSAHLFFLLAFAYVFAGFALRNGFYMGPIISFMRILDIPFAFISLIYGGSGLYLQINKGRASESVWGVLVIAACLVLFGFAVFVNFAFPSAL